MRVSEEFITFEVLSFLFTMLQKWLMEKTEGKGVDVFFECVGKNETVLQAFNVTTPGFRLCGIRRKIM